MNAERENRKRSPEPPHAREERTRSWEAPAIEWEEHYEPVVFAASCTSQPFNCGSGARF